MGWITWRTSLLITSPNFPWVQQEYLIDSYLASTIRGVAKDF